MSDARNLQNHLGEYIAAQLSHSRRGFLGFVSLLICFAAAPMLGLVALIGAISIVRHTAVSASSISQLLFPLFLTLTPLWLYVYWRYRFKASRVSSNPCTLDFEEDHVGIEILGLSKGALEWAGLKKYHESKKILLVYISRVSFFAIPRRAVQNDQYLELIALLQRKLRQEKHKSA